MTTENDKMAGYQLLEQIPCLEFEIIKTDFSSIVGSGQYGIITLQLEEGHVEWGGFGLMFGIAVFVMDSVWWCS